jgi:hypothetical protein
MPEMTLSQLAVKLAKTSIPTTWRYVLKAGWPWRTDPVRGVLVNAPLGEIIIEKATK